MNENVLVVEDGDQVRLRSVSDDLPPLPLLERPVHGIPEFGIAGIVLNEYAPHDFGCHLYEAQGHRESDVENEGNPIDLA